MHRNSQKRYYLDGKAYFLTGVTQDRIPYFEEEIFCEVFSENLRICQSMKGFQLHGWFLGYDHFHLLITPGDEWNVSKIIQFLKRHTSRDINFLLGGYSEGEIRESRLRGGAYNQHQNTMDEHDRFLKSWKSQLHEKWRKTELVTKFQWQRSFHDHIIRNEDDFEAHLKYIQFNPIKHDMPKGWKWIFSE